MSSSLDAPACGLLVWYEFWEEASKKVETILKVAASGLLEWSSSLRAVPFENTVAHIA